jgi:hypothetical protein
LGSGLGIRGDDDDDDDDAAIEADEDEECAGVGLFEE